MKLTAFLMLAVCVSACESRNFQADSRQIMAKDAVRYKLGRVSDYDVVSFQEDTLNTWTDTAIKRPIVYKLHVTFKDSTGNVQARDGWTVFAPDGRSILETRVEGERP